jgi:hypothetical protein
MALGPFDAYGLDDDQYAMPAEGTVSLMSLTRAFDTLPIAYADLYTADRPLFDRVRGQFPLAHWLDEYRST